MSDVNKKEMAKWGSREVLLLIELWSDERLQAMLDTSYRNQDVYTAIQQQMAGKGYLYTWKQCRTKLKSLKDDYKKAKKFHDISGSGRSRFR